MVCGGSIIHLYLSTEKLEDLVKDKLREYSLPEDTTTIMVKAADAEMVYSLKDTRRWQSFYRPSESAFDHAILHVHTLTS